MKTSIFLSVLLSLVVSTTLCAQTPVPDPDTIPNPVKQGDPAIDQLPARLDYIENRRRIMPEELPDAVRHTLESSAQYEAWEKAPIFHDRNKDEYIVEFSEAGKTTTYRFNKEGRPILKE